MIVGLALVIIVVTVVVTVSRSRRHVPPSDVPQATGRAETSSNVAEALVQRWAAAKLISADQADAIRAYERDQVVQAAEMAPRTSRVHAIAESLGYLGGVLGLTGVVILIAQFWNDFDDSIRLAVPAVATVVLIIAGGFVHERSGTVMWRLRTFLWTLATATAGVFGWVFARSVLEVDDERRVWMSVGCVVAVVSFSLWARRDRPIQQFTGLVGTAMALATFVGEFAFIGFSGLILWGAAFVLLAASVRRSGTGAVVNVLAASIALVVGGFLTVEGWAGPGLLFLMATGIILVAPASLVVVQLRSVMSTITGIVGAIALVRAVPAGIAHYAHDAGIATGLVVWGAGVGVSLLARRRVLRLEVVFDVVGGLAFIVGAAVTSTQSMGFATIFGLCTSIALIAVGTRPGRVAMSIFGLTGLLVFIPWTIGHFFPGQGRVPILVIVSGLVLVGVAVALTRLSGRVRGEVFERH